MATQSPETPDMVGSTAKSGFPPIWAQLFRLAQRQRGAQPEPYASAPSNPETLTTDAYRRNYKLALVGLTFLSAVLAVFLALLTLMLVMAFFGDERQSSLALRMLTVGGQALGGGGFVLMMGYGIKRLLER